MDYFIDEVDQKTHTCGMILLQTVPNKISDSMVILKPTEEDVKKIIEKKLKKCFSWFRWPNCKTSESKSRYIFTYYNGFFE